MNTRTLQTSFVGGELTPQLYGRPDLRAYQNGAAKLENWTPLPTGAVRVRPGLKFVAEAGQAAASRLIPFSPTRDVSYAVELGTLDPAVNNVRGYLRAYAGGGRAAHSIGYVVDEVDVANDQLVFAADHAFQGGEFVRLMVGNEPPASLFGGQPLPGGLAKDETYQVVLVDRRRISLLDSGSSPVTLTSVGGVSSTYKLWIYLADRMAAPLRYRRYHQVADINAAEGWFFGINGVSGADHEFGDGEPVRVSGNGGLPPELETGRTYYVQRIDDGGVLRYRLKESPDSPYVIAPLTIPGGMSGMYVGRFYDKGTYVHRIDSATDAKFSITTDEIDMSTVVTGNPLDTKGMTVPFDGMLDVPAPWTVEDISKIRYAQESNELTMVSPTMDPQQLRLLNLVDGPKASDPSDPVRQLVWSVKPLTFGTRVDPPSNASITVTPTRGGKRTIRALIRLNGAFGAANLRTDFIFDAAHHLGPGDVIWVENVPGVSPSNAYGIESDNHYIVEMVSPVSIERRCLLQNLDGSQVSAYAGFTENVEQPFTADVYLTSLAADNTQEYAVTSVDSDGLESLKDGSKTVTNNLFVDGAKNTLTWTAVEGATLYRVYKKKSGLFGLIGEAEEPTFVDDNIDPDLEKTYPFRDEQFDGVTTFRPRSVTYYQQRLWFGGTADLTQTVWASRTGSTSDFSFSVPSEATDRIRATPRAGSAHAMQHLVSLDRLVALSESGEWRIEGGNDEAITPANISMKVQSEVGADDPTPVIVEDTIVYADGRSRHLRTLAFSSYDLRVSPGDLSVRASHLFDGYQITSLAHSKSPYSIVYATSSSGMLLSTTFLPQEEVIAISRHVTDGSFVSCTAIPDGNEDGVYVLVDREDASGQTVRVVERMQDMLTSGVNEDAVLDSYLSTFESATRTGSMTIARAANMGVGSIVRVTSSTPVFIGGDVGNKLELIGSSTFPMQIRTVTSATEAWCRLEKAVSLSELTFTSYRFGFDTFRVPDHLADKRVTIATERGSTTQVATGGVVQLTSPATFVRIGLPYTATLQTLPLAFQADAAGGGRTKNVSRAWVRVYESAGLQVGPNESSLVDIRSLESNELSTGETRTDLRGEWTDSGQIVIQQSKPLPATVVGLTLQVEIGS